MILVVESVPYFCARVVSHSRTRMASFPFVLVMVCNSDFTFASIRLYPKAFTVPKIGWPVFHLLKLNTTI